MNPRSGRYVLVNFLDDSIENRLLKIIDMKHAVIPAGKKAAISKILEPFQDKIQFFSDNRNIFYANMYANPGHVFFFEHPNEHVPGIMLIETLRQFVIACCHEYGKIPHSGTQVILDSIEAKFINYADLNYPIDIRGKVEECRYNSQGFWDYLDISIEVYQNDEKITDFYLKGKSISNRLYDRIRRKRASETNKHRFQLYPNINPGCSLKCIGDSKYINTNLVDISSGGFRLNINDLGRIRMEKEGFEFFLFYENVGFIHGTCKNIWVNDKTMESGFKITEISEEDKNKLLASISRYFYLVENRENYTTQGAINEYSKR